ncbi:Cut8 six-helix bundle-domain-containing protein [Paraphysoderma sedebokerense]|nr:Cut8 six-helix bundle-domain-containing protein [Paraphysoderma sedebokerense]
MDNRKRKLSFSEEDEESLDFRLRHSHLNGHSDPRSQRTSMASFNGKRSRYNTDLERDGDENVNGDGRFELAKYLPILSKSQLISLLTNLTSAHPTLTPVVQSLLPRPTIPSVKSYFESLHRKLEETFPYNRHGTGKDDYSFNRVKGVIYEIKDTILSFAQYFSTSPVDFPTATFAYLLLATEFATNLPEFDNPSNNIMKRETLAKLKEYWRGWISEVERKNWEGRVFTAEMVGDWWKGIASIAPPLSPTYDDLPQQFKQRLGYIINLAPPPSVPPSLHSQFAMSGNNSPLSISSPSCSVALGQSHAHGVNSPVRGYGPGQWTNMGMVADGNGRID